MREFINNNDVVNEGGRIAQRERSRFSPSGPEFESPLDDFFCFAEICEICSLLLSMCTVEKSNPSSACKGFRKFAVKA